MELYSIIDEECFSNETARKGVDPADGVTPVDRTLLQCMKDMPVQCLQSCKLNNPQLSAKIVTLTSSSRQLQEQVLNALFGEDVQMKAK